MAVAALTVALLLLLSAVLTAAHDAAFQLGASHVRTLGEEGFVGAAALARVRESKDAVQASVRVVTQALDLASLGVIALTSVSTWGLAGPVPSTVIGGVLVLAVGDLIPHLLASRRPVRLALSAAPALLLVERLARPLVAPVTILEERMGSNGDHGTEEYRELKEIRAIGEQEGVLEKAESLLVERAFRLDETTAWDVMTPRVDMFAWKEEHTLQEIMAELEDVPYSRVPVYHESVDDVTGIVYVREAYKRIARGERDTLLKDFAREAIFVPGSLSLTQLLQDFQSRRIHMGIVADEFGGTDGLVTLEDILEELVGEIRDETDVEHEEVTRVADDVVDCAAGVDLRDLEEILGVSLPEREHRSLNGFILDELGHVPAHGETFETAGVRIEVLEASDTQVLRARVTRLAMVLQEPED